VPGSHLTTRLPCAIVPRLLLPDTRLVRWRTGAGSTVSFSHSRAGWNRFSAGQDRRRRGLPICRVENVSGA